MAEAMTEERVEIIELKRKLRDMKVERDRYLHKYVELLEERSSARGGCRHDYCERCGQRLPENSTHSCPRVTYDTSSPFSGGDSVTVGDHTWAAPTDGTTTGVTQWG